MDKENIEMEKESLKFDISMKRKERSYLSRRLVFLREGREGDKWKMGGISAALVAASGLVWLLGLPIVASAIVCGVCAALAIPATVVTIKAIKNKDGGYAEILETEKERDKLDKEIEELQKQYKQLEGQTLPLSDEDKIRNADLMNYIAKDKPAIFRNPFVTERTSSRFSSKCCRPLYKDSTLHVRSIDEEENLSK